MLYAKEMGDALTILLALYQLTIPLTESLLQFIQESLT